jgi:hypothetical protein
MILTAQVSVISILGDIEIVIGARSGARANAQLKLLLPPRRGLSDARLSLALSE